MRAFIHDERGTAMTETVITLPIFLVIFLGVVGLHRLQDAATRAHPIANRALWQQAYMVANSEPGSSWGNPAHPGNYHYTNDFDTLGYDEAKQMRLDDMGTLGEAMNGSVFESRDWRFYKEPVQDTDRCLYCAYDWAYATDPVGYNGATYAIYAGWDAGHRALSMPGNVAPELSGFRAKLGSPSQSRLAYGAGTRYGIVAASASSSVTWKRFHATFSPQYQVVAPSRALESDTEAFWTVGQGRVELEAFEYADLLGFEPERRFKMSATEMRQ